MLDYILLSPVPMTGHYIAIGIVSLQLLITAQSRRGLAAVGLGIMQQ